EEAYGLSQESFPPADPFAASATSSTDEAPAPARPAPELQSALPDFEAITRITDRKDADTAMRSLLQACQELKISDLHLSANARPFGRLNRSVHYLSDVVLTPE